MAAPGPASSTGSPPRTTIDRLTRRSWTSYDGLPVNAVHAICPARDGYLWVATEEGLARFDGKQFTVFWSGNEPAFEDDNLQTLAETADGFLWIGSRRGGLVRYRKRRFERIGPASGLSSKKVTILSIGSGGVLWVGTTEGKVFWRDGEAFHQLSGLPAEAVVLAITETPDGALWVGTRSHGLFRAGRPDRHLMGVPGLPAGPVSCFGIDASGRLWAGIEGGGVCVGPRAGGACEKVLTRRDGLPSDGVTAMLKDSKGRLWIGTYRGGLAVAENGTVYRAGDVTNSNSIWCFAEGPPGTFWIGTVGGGLCSRHEGTITALTEIDGLAPGSAFTICESADGSAWIGSDDRKLTRFTNGVATVHSLGSSEKDRYVSVVWPRKGGGVWAGTYGGGIYEVAPQGDIIRHLARNEATSDAVRALVEDVSGVLWVGSRAGLARLSGLEGSPSFETVLNGTSVTALALGAGGEVYAGTRTKGLAVIERGGSIRFYGSREGLGVEAVTSLYLDPEDRLWIGTAGGGIALLHGGKLTRWRTTDGLFTDSINCIVEDGRGRLWTSTNRGIFYLEKKALVAAGGGRVESVPFGRTDGMPVEETNAISQPAGWRMRDGTIWFPTVSGVVVVDPSRLGGNVLPPRLDIESVTVDGRISRTGAPVTVEPGWRRMTVGFTAISLADANRLTCRYRLEGFEPEWTDARDRREATYTNLPPGRYRFRLEARILGSSGSTVETALPIRVVPAFHQTPGFFVLIAGLVSALAWGAHHIRVRHLRLRNAAMAERSHMAQEVHDNMSQIMTGLLLQLDVAEQSLSEGGGGRLEEYLRKARDMARQGIEEARRTARGLRAAALDSCSLALALRQTTSSLTEGTPVRVEVREEGPPRRLSAGVENELFRIGQEAVTNALRHGGARHIELTVAYETRGIRLTCGDDGRGIDPAMTTSSGGAGMGLSGMWRRLDERHGTLSVRARPGGGTLVEAFMPTPAEAAD